MFIKYFLGDRGIEPCVMTKGAACADLALPETISMMPISTLTVSLEVAFDIPTGWCLYIQPRSSTFTKHGILVPTGIIDTDYKGFVHAQLFNMNNHSVAFERGTRLVQVHILPTQHFELEAVEFMPDSERIISMGSTGV